MTVQQISRRNRTVFSIGLPLAGLTVGGFLVGLFVVRLSRGTVYRSVGFLEGETLHRLSVSVFLPQSLFWYLLKRRMVELTFLLLLSMTLLGKIGGTLYFVCIGGMQGMFFMTLAQQYGMKGVGLFLLASFPQCFVLIPAMWVLLTLNRRLYVKASYKRYGGEYTERKNLIEGILLCFLLYGLAAWMQSYVNPFLLQKYLQIF